MKILTGAQFKELDQYTIKNEPISAIDLMERAAKAIAEEVSTRWSLKTHFYIFAGPGNNGGDALAVARLLAEKGYKATVYLFNINQKLSEECAFNKECLAEYSNIKFIEVHDQFTFPNIEEKDVIIDGLFGTGLNKPLNGGFASLAQSINKTNVPIVSIDIPSGLMCEDNTYNDMNTVVRATLTLTIQLPKMAFLFPENQKYIGELKVLDIQLDMKYMENVATNMYLLESDMACKLLKKRHAFAHKGNMGHALVVAGSFGMAGASIFCAKACMKAGAGKVTIHTPKMNNDILQIAVPEAILSHDLDDDIITGSIETGSFNALVIGPGIGKSETTAIAMRDFMLQQSLPLVLDADALNILGNQEAIHRHHEILRAIGLIRIPAGGNRILWLQGRNNLQLRRDQLLRNRLGPGIRITGYTDHKGTDAVNRRISLMRAEAVKEWLVKRYGICPERILAEGAGVDRRAPEAEARRAQSKADNCDAAGQQEKGGNQQ